VAHSAGTYLRAGIFQTVWGMVKYLPTGVGDWIRFAVLKLFMKKIGTAWIHSGVTIWWPERISIGDGSINEDIHLNGFGGITVGDRVLLGHRTTLFSDEHIFDDPARPIWDQGRKAAPITIEDDVYLGCNVVVLAGVTIGRGAVIGAGSVVTRDVPPLAIAVGAPARVIGKRGDRPAQ
jgi:acetyltransferase-like isoleucine patch superfamily enzyme